MIFKGHSNAVTSVTFSATSQYLISASEDQTIRVWDWAHNSEMRLLRGHQSPIRALALTPQFVAAADAATIKLWDSRVSQDAVAVPGSLKGNFHGGEFGADGRQVALAAADGSVQLWDWRSAEPPKSLGKSSKTVPYPNSPP